MTSDFEWYAGIDWASEQHRVCLLDGGSRRAGEREFAHSGDGLAELCAWLIAMSGWEPRKIAVAIETPHGPVVEMLIDHGFAVHSINPKQLDRFRDRFTVAGAKDDSRDAQVLGHSLKTDAHAFRRLVVDDPMIIELREWSRLGDDLKQERNRLANRLRQQLWRYYPQMLELGGDDIAADWLLALWDEAPTPAKAAEISTQVIAPLLKAHRIRRFEAAIKEIWSLQPRFEQRSGQRPFRLIEHARFRAGWDFLELRCRSGELEGERAQLADWWDRFANAAPEAREAMLKPDTEPKKRTRARSRGRKRRPEGEVAPPAPNPDAPPSE